MNTSPTEQPANRNKRPNRRRTALVATLAAAGVAGTTFVPHLLAGEKSETMGKVPGVETCVPRTASAIGNKACAIALQVAGDVVARKAPRNMHITETSTAHTTTFGKPTYTITQKSAGDINPITTQQYRVSFAMNEHGQADLSNVVEEVGVNDKELAYIDHTGGSTYNAGFHDSTEVPTPITYATANAADMRHMADASITALGGFIPVTQ